MKVTSIISNTVTFALIWAGIYYGIFQGVSFVSNLLAVFITLIACSFLFIQIVAQYYTIASDELVTQAIKDSFAENQYGSFWSAFFTLNTFATSLILISVGGWWILPGAMILLGKISQIFLFSRVSSAT